MNPPGRPRLSRLLCAGISACLFLTACDPVDGPVPTKPVRYKAPPLDTHRPTIPQPESSRWLSAWRGLKEEMEPLKEKLHNLQEFHSSHQMDEFLKLDPETLDKDQLCTMFHFLERGYFTVERRILIDLLQRHLERAREDAEAPSPGIQTSLTDQFIAAMHRDELRVLDIEKAIAYYSKAGTADIQIPNSLSDAEHEELLTTVNGLVEKTRSEVAGMDAKIKSLRLQAYPDDPVVNPPGPEPAPAEEQEPPTATEPTPGEAPAAMPDPAAAPESEAASPPDPAEPEDAPGSSDSPEPSASAESPLPQ